MPKMSQEYLHGPGQKRWIPWLIVLGVFGLSFGGPSFLLHRERADKSQPGILQTSQVHRVPPQRIISLAPSVTEVLFALGLGDRVVGVTQHCRYPAAALAKAKVGDYYQPDYEAILALKPDLVILLPEHEEAQEYLDRLGVKTLMVNHFTIQGILDSILLIGRTCGRAEVAEEMVQEIRERMETIRRRTMSLPAPRVMVSVGRNMGSGGIKDVYVCGQDGFYDQMIELAGGRNALQGGGVKFPIVSGEGILRLNPQVILDVVPDLAERGWKEEKILRQWDLLSQVDAVAHRRVHLLSQGFAVIPGPRFILILEEMARLIHPEVRWGPA
jgi:iron complex transport system substrate-binding protein